MTHRHKRTSQFENELRQSRINAAVIMWSVFSWSVYFLAFYLKALAFSLSQEFSLELNEPSFLIHTSNIGKQVVTSDSRWAELREE